MKTFLRDVISVLVSCALWAAAFHPLDLWPLAWVALVPAFVRFAAQAGSDEENIAVGGAGVITGINALVARQRVIASSRLQGEANVLIFPNLDAGSTALQLSRVIADALPVGPILIGPAKPAHVLTPSVTARGIVNMTAIAAVEAASG